MFEYPIVLEQDCVGKAEVVQKGLFYWIRCCYCDDPADVRIHVAGEKDIDLGCAVPAGDAAYLEAILSVKLLGSGNLHFYAAPKAAEFILVSCDAPFAYLTQLKDASLLKRGSQFGVVFKKQYRFPIPPDNGQSP